MRKKLLSILLLISILAMSSLSFAADGAVKDADEIKIKDYKIEQVFKENEKKPKNIEKDTEFSILIYPENINYDILSTYIFTMVPNDNFKVLSSKVEKADDKGNGVIVFNLKALEKLDKDSYKIEVFGSKIKDNLELKTELGFKEIDFKEEKSGTNGKTNSNDTCNTNNGKDNSNQNTNTNGEDNMVIENPKTNDTSNSNSNIVSEGGGETSNPSVKNKPKLIIDNYSLQPKMVEAGKEFTLNMSFYNTNATYSVRNIKISLNNETGGSGTNGQNVGGSVFIPVGSSNTFYISSIAPGKTASKSIKMSVVPNAQAQNYVITANFEYEDKNGNEFTANEIIGIPVVQQAKVSFGEITTNPGMAGEPATVDMDFFNTGKDTLTNFMISVQGDGFSLDNGGNYFVGNFAPGASDHFSSTIIPTESGTAKGKLVITYEDSTGETHTEEKDFSVEAQQMDEGTTVPDEEMDQGTGSMGALPFILGGLLIIAIITTIIVKKKRDKKKKGSDLQLWN